jgi:L-ribulose-5-phosphate 3-epimerase UlaE
MINRIYASKVVKGDTIVVNGIEYTVLDTARYNSTIMVWVMDTPFVSSNYMSFNWNDYVQVAFPDCERCKWDSTISHTNCLYYGTWHSGHSSSHCTANACY